MLISCTSCTGLPFLKLASQTCGFNNSDELASASGEMPFHVKSPAVLAVCPDTCCVAAKSLLAMAVCMKNACSSRKKEHHAGISYKRTPFGE